MKKIHLYIILLSTILSACVKEKDFSAFQLDAFIKSYKGQGLDQAIKVVQTSDGGYLILASTQSANDEVRIYDISLIKTDAYGNELWNKTYGTDEDEKASGMIVSDNEIVIIGTQYINDSLGTDMYFLSVNSSGDLNWEKTYGGAGNQRGKAVYKISGQGYFIGGDIDSESDADPDKVGNDYLVYWTDLNGNTIQQNVSGTDLDETINAFTYDPLGDRIVGAAVASTSGYIANNYSTDDTKALYVAYSENADGSTLTKSNPEVEEGVGYSYGIKAATQGNQAYVLSTYVSGTSPRLVINNIVEKGSGIAREAYNVGEGSNQEAVDFYPTDDGGFIVVANNLSNNNVGIDLIKVSSSFTTEWTTNFGDIGLQSAASVIQTADGGYLICGNNEIGTSSSIVLIKTNSSGELKSN